MFFSFGFFAHQLLLWSDVEPIQTRLPANANDKRASYVADDIIMSSDFFSSLERALKHVFPGLEALNAMFRLSGGASQETWSFDAVIDGALIPLILRRAPGGVR